MALLSLWGTTIALVLSFPYTEILRKLAPETKELTVWGLPPTDANQLQLHPNLLLFRQDLLGDRDLATIIKERHLT